MSQTVNIDLNTLCWLIALGVFFGNLMTSLLSVVLAVCVKAGAWIGVRLFGK